MAEDMRQIGEVAERVGLSLRTIRHYEEVDLVLPSGRTSGGFRLYTEDDIARLELVKQMKPLEFSLEEMREVLEIRDRLASEPDDAERRSLQERLAEFAAAARGRCERLEAALTGARAVADMLRKDATRRSRTVKARAGR